VCASVSCSKEVALLIRLSKEPKQAAQVNLCVSVYVYVCLCLLVRTCYLDYKTEKFKFLTTRHRHTYKVLDSQLAIFICVSMSCSQDTHICVPMSCSQDTHIKIASCESRTS